MRRLVTVPRVAALGLARFLVRQGIALAEYLVDLFRTAGRAWHTFFFTPADPTPLGRIRIAVGSLALWNYAVLGLDLRSNLGSDGWASPEALRAFYGGWKWGSTAWSLWLLVPDRLLPLAWAAGLVVLALFTLGLWSRVSAVLAWVILVSTSRRAPVLFFGFDEAMLTWTMYLAACGASGQALSLDRILARSRRRRGRRGAGSAGGAPAATVSANLGLRLIQLHLCLIYAAAGLSKLQGRVWWSGDATLMILLAPEYRVGHLAWLAAYPRVLNFLTHATVALELLYPILVWVRVCRPLMLLGMIGLHVGIILTMGLTEFSLSMIAANLAFVAGPGHPPPEASRTRA